VIGAQQPSGFIAVDKPAGITSFDVIRELRRLLGIKRMGHSGVLDKPATGVLVVGVNQATRLFELFNSFEKEYAAQIWLGVSTTTDDLSGELTSAPGATGLSEDTLRRTMQDYTGTIDQIPPAFSLTKVGGRELYRYALSGAEVEAKPKRVTVYAFELAQLSSGLPPAALDGLCNFQDQLPAGMELGRLDVTVRGQGGIYIRSLARDIGADLDSAGTLGRLVRLRVGPFHLDDALGLPEIAQRLSAGARVDDLLLPVASIAPLESQLTLDAAQLNMVRTGRSIRRFKHHLPPGVAKRGDTVYGMNSGHELVVILSVGEVNQHGLVELKPSKVLS
jgi:tRNA pseudouridine55 synthase